MGTNPPARTTPIRLLVEAKASTAFLRRARVCSQQWQRGIAGQRVSRQAAGQSRAQKEEVTSVLASHRHPHSPQRQNKLLWQSQPQGELWGPKPRYQKDGYPAWQWSGKNDYPGSRGPMGEESRETSRDGM